MTSILSILRHHLHLLQLLLLWAPTNVYSAGSGVDYAANLCSGYCTGLFVFESDEEAKACCEAAIDYNPPPTGDGNTYMTIQLGPVKCYGDDTIHFGSVNCMDYGRLNDDMTVYVAIGCDNIVIAENWEEIHPRRSGQEQCGSSSSSSIPTTTMAVVLGTIVSLISGFLW